MDVSIIDTKKIVQFEQKLNMVTRSDQIEFYHYTSLDGLQGILKDNEFKKPIFYFSQYDRLNDAKERKNLYETVEKYLSDAQASGKFSKEFCDLVNNIKTDDRFHIFYNEDIDGNSCHVQSEKECYIYLCSFSYENDSVPMWRCYSKGSGFNIQLIDPNFGHQIPFGYDGYKMRICKVIYDAETKYELLDELLLYLYELYCQLDDKNDTGDIELFIRSGFRKLEFIFKDEAFKYEREIRAILEVPKETEEIEGEISKRLIRNVGEFDVPYVKVYLNVWVKGIKISPLNKDNNDEIKQAVNDKLSKTCFNKVKIEKSQLQLNY